MSSNENRKRVLEKFVWDRKTQGSLPKADRKLPGRGEPDVKTVTRISKRVLERRRASG